METKITGKRTTKITLSGTEIEEAIREYIYKREGDVLPSLGDVFVSARVSVWEYETQHPVVGDIERNIMAEMTITEGY